MSLKDFFDAAREIAGGSLTQHQVDELNKVVSFLTKIEHKTSQFGINLITEFEGIKLNAYDDGVGIWTIGIGTTVYPNGIKVKKGDKCTKDQAIEYLHNDLKRFECCINEFVKVKINQNQYDALSSLVYNIGPNAFKNSTLLKKLNNSDYLGAANEFLKWNKAGGKVLAGLDRRRKKEHNLFITNY